MMELNINNWKLAFRNLIKQKRTTILNILGLACGFTTVLFLSTYVYRELTYDAFHKNVGRIFKPEFEIVESKADIDLASNLSLKEIELFRNNVPGIETITFLNYSRWDWDNGAWIEYKGNRFNIERLAFSDKYFDEIFSFETHAGNLSNSLDEPGKLVLTKNIADKIFGIENPIGQEVLLNDKPTIIGAILENVPSSSSIQINGLVSYKSARYFFGNDITDWSNIPFIKIENNAASAQVSGIMSKALLASLPKEEIEKINPVFSTKLIPIRELYFHKAKAYDPTKHGSKRTTYILLGIGIIILFLAIINYNNLLLVTSLKWKKDVGIQQILGASRNSVQKQLFMKGCIISVVAFCLAILIISISLPGFNQLINYPLQISDFTNSTSAIIAFGLLFFTVLFSGLIPSVLSGRPILVAQIKGLQANQKNYDGVWKTMVTFQLFISIALIISSLVITKQINYSLGKDLGLNVKNIVTIPTSKLGDKKNAYINTVTDHVQTISSCRSTSYINTFNIWGGKLKEPGINEKSVDYNNIRVNDLFLQTLGLELVAGRDFRKDNLADERTMIVNETFVKNYDVTNPLEATIRGFPIIGVVKDFNFNSLHHPIEPVVLWNTPKNVGLSSMHFSAHTKADVKAYMDFLRAKWEKLSSGKPFEYEFIDDRLRTMYQKDIVLAKSIISFSAFAIFIACLGIFGLLSYIMEMKIKEIGIRKVNGAKVFEILKLVNYDLVKWITCAFIIACPIAYYAMNKWLENFAYKTTLSWWIFALAGVLALGIALLTVSWQSWRAATRNPVGALRYE